MKRKKKKKELYLERELLWFQKKGDNGKEKKEREKRKKREKERLVRIWRDKAAGNQEISRRKETKRDGPGNHENSCVAYQRPSNDNTRTTPNSLLRKKRLEKL
jgi:hypothetical protein